MFSLGIGLTSNCNLHCAHCYRDQDHIHNLTLIDIQKVCESLEIASIGFCTGENGLNPDYYDILDYLHNRRIKLTLASNGYTLSMTPDDMLTYFGDVEFSVDFPEQARQDKFRGEGNWKTIMEGIERCRGLGIRFKASGLSSPIESVQADFAAKLPWRKCYRPQTLMYITANGNVLPCCISPFATIDYSSIILGNAFESALEEIWKGSKYTYFRKRLQTETPPKCCRGCGVLWSL